MATWLDGPEYAPTARPREFAAPHVPPLDTAPPRPQPSAELPRAMPQFQARAQQRELATHGPPEPPGRDPQEAFAVAGSSLTDFSGGSEPRDPTQPLNEAGAVAIDRGHQVSAWGAAHRSPHDWPPPAPMPARAPDAGFTAVLKAATPGVLIPLLIGGLIVAIAPVALLVAAGFSTRVRQARTAVRGLLVAAAAVLVAWFLITLLFNGLQLGAAWQATLWPATGLSWVGLIGTLAVVARSLGRGEAPER